MPPPDDPERAAALIVDDDPWTRLLLTDIMSVAGYVVQEASNGAAALRMAEREPPALVLLDLVMPEESGLSVLERLKGSPSTSHVPVIVVSGAPERLRAAAHQPDAVVEKPFTLAELLAEVDRAMRPARSRPTPAALQ
jgi:CheY-like chemotaxis protein